MIDDFVRLEGRRLRDVLLFLQEPPKVFSPPGKRLTAVWTFQKLCAHQSPAFNVEGLRDEIAVEAQRARDTGRFIPSEVTAAVAERIGIPAAEINERMFSDLPMERRLVLPDPIPDPHSLAMQTNLALAQGLLNIASEVAIQLYGGARAVVRQVHLRRLLCTAERSKEEGMQLKISGAFSLFRHTTMYGHALASILSPLLWCERFDLMAHCVLRERELNIHLSSRDPIERGRPPQQFDSRIEERFARDFARTNLDWDLVREPEPLEACGTLIFPDFAVVHRRDTSKRFLLEIVGFWTPDYLREKLRRLRHLSNTPLILCIDRSLNCGKGELPAHSQMVLFHKRIDPCEVLAAIESAAR